MDLQKKPKKKLVEQEQTFFTLDDELLKMFVFELKDNAPDDFFKRIWVANPQEQHLADLFVIAKMAEYYKKEQSFMIQLEGHCQVETKKQIKSEERPDYIKYRKYYEAAEDVFNQKGLKVSLKCKKDATLQSVSKDTIEKNNSSGFIKRRVVDAFEKKKVFEGYLRSLIDKSFGTDVQLVVNSKEEARAIEKVREMEMEPHKYKAPVENYLYDLLRAQIRLDPEDLHPDDISDNMDKIVQFLDQLAKEDKLIRFKNKLAELGQIMCNFIYENQIVELQIVFTESLDSLKRSHVVYDLERLKDLTAVRTYLMKKNRGMLSLFAKIGMNAFDDQIKKCDKVGSLVFPHFIHYVMTHPSSKEFPSFPRDTLLTYKGWKEGKIVYNEEKKAYEGFKMKVMLSDGNEYECELLNFKIVGSYISKLPGQGRYDGDRKDGKRNGKGKMTYENGDVYEGNWVNDKRNGQGEMTYKKGDNYEGNWQNDQRNGKGRMTYSNGDVYEGNWENDRRNGEGKMKYKRGDIYEGSWKNDSITGNGKYTWGGERKGQVYEGNWENDRKNGKGKMTFKNGDVYEGGWKDDLYSGSGSFVSVSGYTYNVEYIKGERHGKGSMKFNGNLYEGDWKNDKRTGYGHMTYNDGSLYKGDWKEDLRSGNGEYTYDDNGYRYKGQWANDNMHGQGVLLQSQFGSTWKTEFTKVVKKGEWRNGEYLR